MSDESVIGFIVINLVLLAVWSTRNKNKILKSEFINEDYLMLIGFRPKPVADWGRKPFVKADRGSKIEVEQFYDCWHIEVYNYRTGKKYYADINATEELRNKIEEFMKLN